MKKILFMAMLLPVIASAQNDTIFKKDGKKTSCEITLVNEGAIFYKDKKGYGNQIENSKVNYYSLNGKRHESIEYNTIDYSAFKLDTSRNESGHFKLSRVLSYIDTSLNKNVLFDKTKAFLYKTYGLGKDVVLYDDKINGEFQCEASTKTLNYNGEILKNCNGGKFKYKISIYTKDQKLKVVFNDIVYQKGLCPLEAESGSDFGDTYPSKWSKINHKINQNQYAEFKKEALKEFNFILNYLEHITSTKNKDGDF